MEQRLFDCQQMFRHACAFSDIADIAEREFRVESIQIEWYTTPSIVNSAFACEVYLKALLLYYDDPKFDDHKLFKLYERLPKQVQESIELKLMEDYGCQMDLLGHDQLKIISNAFTDWRYSYELGRNKRNAICADIGFLTTFRNTLREVCCQLFFEKTWEKYSR